MTKCICANCGLVKEHWAKGVCSECYYILNKDVIKANSKRNKRNLKIKTVDRLGGKCACCGEVQREFLSIDHINKDGAQHRRSLVGRKNKRGEVGGAAIYRDIEKQGYPKDKYRILCMNCNMAYSAYGYCPHQNKSVWPEFWWRDEY